MLGPFGRAIELLFSGDREVYFIAWTSLRISLVSVLISSALIYRAGYSHCIESSQSAALPESTDCPMVRK